MGVIRTGKPVLEVNEAGNRFEVEIVLLDKSGANIGALSAVYALPVRKRTVRPCTSRVRKYAMSCASRFRHSRRCSSSPSKAAEVGCIQIQGVAPCTAFSSHRSPPPF